MINLIALEKTESTNTYAKALLKSGEPLHPFTVVFAKEQTKGRGRLNRIWESTKGDSLCMSLILPDTANPSLTLLSALGVHKVLSEYSEDLQIKWPNDIIANNKKLCGILTEGTEKGTVVGIGINLNQTEFSDEIAHKATSLKLLTSNTYSTEELCKKVAESVFEVIEKHQSQFTKEALKEYTTLCANIRKEVFWQDKKGVATGISEDGSLIVKTKEGEERIRFGEVFVNGIY